LTITQQPSTKQRKKIAGFDGSHDSTNAMVLDTLTEQYVELSDLSGINVARITGATRCMLV